MTKYAHSTRQEKSFRDLTKTFENDWEYLHERALLDITERIVAEMESRGITRSKLADELHVSRAYISQLLGGKPDFTLGTLFKVARALGMKPVIEFKTLEGIQRKFRHKMPSPPSSHPVGRV